MCWKSLSPRGVLLDPAHGGVDVQYTMVGLLDGTAGGAVRGVEGERVGYGWVGNIAVGEGRGNGNGNS